MILRNQSIAHLNTFGLNATANLYCEIESIAALQSVWKSNLLVQSSPLILGGGSNILFTQDYPGLILLNKLKGKNIIEEDENALLVSVSAGENWHETVLWAVKNGWGGIENLSLIPGSVGAAPIQNIGAYGAEIEQVLVFVEAFDFDTGQVVQLSHSDCQFGYRDSYFKNEGKGRYFITAVGMRLQKNPTVNVGYGDIQAVLERKNMSQPGIADVSAAIIEIRQSKLPDPALLGNCGSFFKNPIVPVATLAFIQQHHPEVKSFPAQAGFVKLPAAWLIEQCGWKGFREGDAGVHEKQALVLVNYGTAKGTEIIALAKKIQQSVLDTFQVSLEMEVNRV
ncbi:MAG: UDP-N-acetylmuramate dehydrogenase [Bacteroidia bacterium]|nr:UDP-N-acetylmuramate dehydrogenase [Bacteroidia bacterium]